MKLITFNREKLYKKVWEAQKAKFQKGIYIRMLFELTGGKPFLKIPYFKLYGKKTNHH